MERRYTNHRATVEKREDGKGTITGYAAVFYRDGDHSTEYVLWDDQFSRAVERVTPSAFSRALREKQDIRALFNHDPNQLLGRTTAGTATVTVDETGLRYEIAGRARRRGAHRPWRRGWFQLHVHYPRRRRQVDADDRRRGSGS